MVEKTGEVITTVDQLAAEPLIYDGERCISFDLVDRLHGRKPGAAYKAYYRNRERFTEGKHFHRVDDQYPLKGDWGIGPSSGGKDPIVLTKKGYLLLVKPMGDNKSWQVQEQLIDKYFEANAGLHTVEGLLTQAMVLLEAKAVETQIRVDVVEDRVELVEEKTAGHEQDIQCLFGNIAKAPSTRVNNEHPVRDRWACELGGKTEVPCDAGVIDIYVPGKWVVEVKDETCWKYAMGQVRAYVRHDKDCRMMCVLFTPPGKQPYSEPARRKVALTMNQEGVAVYFDGDAADYNQPAPVVQKTMW